MFLKPTSFSRILTCIGLGLSLVLVSCGGENCDGPAMDYAKLRSLLQGKKENRPFGYLVIPNPIEASQNASARADSEETENLLRAYSLPDLTSPKRLENAFIKIRIRSIKDSLSELASPNSKGEFSFKLRDIHYSEVMAYHSVMLIQRYVEALGFSIVKSHPFYVMVRAESSDGNKRSINAIYDHNYLNPNLPRTMKLFGDTPFAPAMDQDIFLHEFGHLLNESVSHEEGIDFAGDSGATYTEAAALHECLADYLAESFSDRPHIGRWLARNLDGFKAGAPLRQAVDGSEARLAFKDVGFFDGRASIPERYQVAEWCTRVLWSIRQILVSRDKEGGRFRSDRLMFSAVSLLQHDTSFSRFREALLETDQKLFCGQHQDGIARAFEERGFVVRPPALSSPLEFKASPLSLDKDGKSLKPTAGKSITFSLHIANHTEQTARNVRVRLESEESLLVPTTYMQAYGDMPPASELKITTKGPLNLDFSVQGELDSNALGRRVRYRLRLLTENAPDRVLEGELQL